MRAGDISSAHSLRTMLGISSGPEALDGFMFLNNLVIPGVFIVIFDKVDLWFDITGGRVVVSDTHVNTDLNWSNSICAFPLLSLTSLPDCLRGATPILSVFLHLTYRQKGLLLLDSRPSVIILLLWFHSAFRISCLHILWWLL